MAKLVKTFALVKSFSTPISHNNCSIVDVDLGSNPTPSNVFITAEGCKT